jgi:hypothetical protein
LKVGRSKWTKWKKTHFAIWKKCIFFTSILWLVLRLCISKMIFRAWKGAPYNILNHSKWRRIEKDLPKCSIISKRSMMGWSTILIISWLVNINIKKSCASKTCRIHPQKDGSIWFLGVENLLSMRPIAISN